MSRNRNFNMGDFEYSRAFQAKMERAKDETPVTLIHSFGDIKLWHTDLGSGRSRWIVTRDDSMIGTGSTAEYAMEEARTHLPKAAKVEGEIIAYRGWNLVGDLLSSVTMSRILWEGPVMRSDESPIGNYEHGLYSVKIPFAKNMIRQYEPQVHGFVAMPAGAKVVEHERGYRADINVVRLLRVTLPVSDRFIALLEDRYQCQVLKTGAEIEW
jgi:hypothetical protein